jgi:unconventional SNARE in the endoplasmic reticulum protein 1
VAPAPLESKRTLKSKPLSSSEISDNALREIKQLKGAKYQADMRKELLDGDDLTSNLRQRQNKTVGEDMNQASKYYGDMQEKIAEDMLSLTRSLKEQTQTANKIIRKDTELVAKSSRLSEKNMDTLGAESQRLQDHSKRACKCWMWLMIGLVMVIFICEYSRLVTKLSLFQHIFEEIQRQNFSKELLIMVL